MAFISISFFVLALGLPCAMAYSDTKVPWPNPTRVINEAGLDDYLYLMTLALDATKLSYTATWGSYRCPADVNASLDHGWSRRFDLDRNPEDGGFHALVFHHKDRQQVILAFRGTDLNKTTSSGLADSCADSLLWENATWKSLPVECQNNFSKSQLDYLDAAELFAVEALSSLNASRGSVLLTGHSLGAGLAALVAARYWRQRKYEPRVLAFSAPSLDSILRSRMHVDPAHLPSSHFSVVWNKFDPLYVSSNRSANDIGVASCTFAPPETSNCIACYQDEDWRMNSSASCRRCFLDTHVYKHYLDYLSGNTSRVPLFRPACTLPELPLVI